MCKFVVFYVCCFSFYFETYPKIFVYCCADEKYSHPAHNYPPTLNLQNFDKLLGFTRFICIYIFFFFFEEELTRRPSCLSSNIFKVFRSFSSCNYVVFYIFVDARQ